MHRLFPVGLALAGLFSLACAKAPIDSTDTATAALAPPPVNAGPPVCDLLFERIHGPQSSVADAQWLDGPQRMAEARRLRALEARAASLGCLAPHG